MYYVKRTFDGYAITTCTAKLRTALLVARLTLKYGGISAVIGYTKMY